MTEERLENRMIPLAVPNLTGNERKYLDNCIDTTFISSVGEYVNKLEKMVSYATGSKLAVATSAGTTGLHAALTAVGVGIGDLVLIPSFTFIASANAVSHCGALPWCIDIKESDWCMNPELVREALEDECEGRDNSLFHKKSGRRIAAIMPVYTLGNIPDMEQYRHIADAYHIPLVADAACAIGAEYKHQSLAVLADASVLSFNGNKTITCGGGGAVVGNDEALLSTIRHLTTTARTGIEYDFDMVGFNYRMTNIQAAVGCAQMERLNEFINIKKRVREYYEERLKDYENSKGISFFPTTNGGSCWLSGFVLPSEFTIDDARYIIEQLRKRGIESRTFWKPIHLQKPYKNVLCSYLGVTENLWGRVITLPCSTNIMDEELEIVVNVVKDIL